MKTTRHVRHSYDGHRIAPMALLCLFGLCVAASINGAGRAVQDPQTDTDRVYLVHADELKFDRFGRNPDVQIATGNVHFIHEGAHMWCDSAYFYQATNSMKAYSHVVFKQGDTLSLTCDYADYDGMQQLMAARYNVVLKHREQTLYTDSMNYDRLYGNAYFFEGGKLVDDTDELVSDWGNYNTVTRNAVFFYNVVMHSGNQVVVTDTLHYDTQNSVSHVTGPSVVTSGTSVVTTTDGYLFSDTDISELYGRSTVVDKGKYITADSLYHNNQTGENDGFGNVVYIDAINRNALDCGRFYYNETTGYGYATIDALMKDFSQQDTLFVHADSLKMFTYNINTDSVTRTVHGYNKVRAYRTDIQAVCDSMVFTSVDSCLTLYRDPIVWSANRQILGEVIKVYMNDSTVREANVIGQALAIEKIDDDNHYNQMSSRRMDAYFISGVVRRIVSTGNVKSVYYRVDDRDSSFVGLNYLETDTMRMYMSPLRQLQKIWTTKATATMYPITQVPPDKYRLPEFAWFDKVRPLGRDDVFLWRGKGEGMELKTKPREEAPLQTIRRKPTDAEEVRQ